MPRRLEKRKESSFWKLLRSSEKALGSVGTVTKTVSNFLSSICPSWSSWEWSSDAAAEAILPAHLETHFLQEYIIPRSVLSLTGEVTEEEDDDYEKTVRDEDEERGEEGDEENDPDYDSKKDQNPTKGKQLWQDVRGPRDNLHPLLPWKGGIYIIWKAYFQKQQLELDMDQQTGSKSEKESVKAVYCHPAYLTYMQSTSWETLGWKKHKLESRLPGEIWITSDMQMTPPLWHKVKRN